jgi:predicted phage terminase large subunit-like protein
MNKAVEVGSDLLRFTRYCFERGNKQFYLNWHHKVMAQALMSVFIGHTKRLIINVPPRYTKTELAVISFMAWAIGIKPDCQFIHASYSKRLATNNAYNCRALVVSEGYREIFPHVQLKDDSKAKDEWRTTEGGIIYAAGSDGTITGYGAGNLREGFGGAVIIDDPHKAGEAESDVMRQGVIDWFQTTIESRLNSPETPIIVIMQRLHQEDLSGWLLDGGNGEHWEHIKIPVIDDDNQPLWPFKHDLAALERMKNANPYIFAGQYLQEPSPKEGGMIKLEWIKRFNTKPVEKIRIIQSWDTAYKAKQINDPSACTTWLQTHSGYYLLESYSLRGEYPAVKRAIKSKAEQYKPDAVLIEDKSSGQSLIQELKGATIPIIAVKPEADKETRLNAVSSMFEAGQVFFPESAPWLPDFEAELFLFPMGKHDDQVDSTSQALSWMREKGIYQSTRSFGRRRF